VTTPLTDIVHSIDIDAPPEAVWHTLTDPAEVPGWLGCMNYTGEPGSTFHMQPDRAKHAAGDLSGATHCDLVEARAPSAFVFTWYMPGTPKTRVAIRLESLGPGRTRVTLTHSGWDQFPPDMVRAIHQMLDGGWKSHVLPGLKAAAEGVQVPGP
jgi:uncharacterized protein YndB with AHSA1/START domain